MRWRPHPHRVLPRLSRRALGGLLAGGSILSSRPSIEILGLASEFIDLAITTVLLYQLSVRGPVLGLHIAWVLVGYLSYAYTADLYPASFGAIVEARGFRLLTAVFTVFYGITFSRAMDVVPDEGVFGYAPAALGGLLASVVLSVILGMLAFSGYIIVVRNERLVSGESAHFELMERLSVDPQRKHLDRVEMLEGPFGRLYVAVAELTVGSFYLVQCVIVGVAVAAVNAFYPIPEILFLVGVLGSYTSLPEHLPRFVPSDVGRDIEFTIADQAADTFKNTKGMVVVVLCGFGLTMSGLVFVAGLGILTRTVNALATVSLSPASLGGLPLGELAQLVLTLTFVTTLGLLLPVYGIFGFVYWVQQLKRLPPYVALWEACWQESNQLPSVSIVGRPPGLFLQGDGALLLTGLLFVTPDETLPSFGVRLGWCLAWVVVVASIVFAIRAVSERDPQPLRGESRAIFIALWTQLASVFLIGVFLGEFRITVYVAIVCWIGLLLGGILYFPEVDVIAERSDGAGRYLHLLYTTGLFGILLVGAERIVTVPAVVYAGLALLGIVWLYMLRMEQRLESTHA